MTSGLWLSDKTFVDLADGSRHSADFTGTFAGRGGHCAGSGADLAGELAIRGGALSGLWMGLLPDPDPVLRKSGEGQAALDALASDYKVMSCLQTRKLKTLRRKTYSFSPGHLPGAEPDAAAVALCEILNQDLERIDLYSLISEVLDAPFYGLTVAELLWRRDAASGGFRLNGIVPKPRDWFRFDAENRLRYLGDGAASLFGLSGTNGDSGQRAGGNGQRLGSDSGLWNDGAPGILPQPGKIILARHFATYANPYGLRLLSRCLFPVAFKRGGIEFMMRFAERWGMPWIVGKGRPNAAQSELNRMRDSLSGMVQDAVAVVNAGAEVQLMQANGQAGDLHLSVVRHWDDAIAQVLLGQTLTSNIGENGSFAASNTHAGILDDYAEADSTLVKIFFDELAWNYGQITAPGVLTPIFTFDEPEDQAARATLGKDLHAQGVRFTPAYFERRFGLAPDEFTVIQEDAGDSPSELSENMVNGQISKFVHLPLSAPAGVEEKAFAEAKEKSPIRFTPGQQAVENLVAELLPPGITAVQAMTAEILKLIGKAESAEDVERLLSEALAVEKDGGLSSADFQGVLETALFAADMVGQFAARENVE